MQNAANEETRRPEERERGSDSGSGSGNYNGAQRYPLNSGLMDGGMADVINEWHDLIEATTRNELSSSSRSRNILEQRRIDAEIRLAKARDHLFRKRQELAKISPKESLHSNYEEFGKESAVRGELMAAVTASIEARAMENECNNLDNVLKERVNDLLLRRKRGLGKLAGDNFFSHNSRRNKILILLALGSFTVIGIAPRRAAAIGKSCLSSFWNFISLKSNSTGSQKQREETNSNAAEGLHLPDKYREEMDKVYPSPFNESLSLDSHSDSDVISDAESGADSESGPGTPDQVIDKIRKEDCDASHQSMSGLVEEALPILFGDMSRAKVESRHYCEGGSSLASDEDQRILSDSKSPIHCF